MKSKRSLRTLALLVFNLMLTMPVTLEAADSQVEFHAAMNDILARNTAIQAQKSRWEATNKAALPTRLAFLPNITLSHVEYKSKSRTVGTTADARRAGLTAAWNLFRSGADIADWSAATADSNTQESLYNRQILLAERDAAEKIFAYIQLAQQMEIAKRLFLSEKENHRIAKERYAKGLLPRQEVDKVLIDLVNAEARWKNAEIRAADANAQLTAALGHNRVQIVWPWIDKFLDKKTRLESEEFKLDNLPQWKAAQFAYDAEDSRVKRNFRRMLPSVDLLADYNFRNTNYTANEWAGSLSFSLPIFDQLSNYSRYAQEVEQRRIAELTLEQTRRDSEAEWKAAHDSFRTALQTAYSRNESLAIARNLYRDNELRFKIGKISANELNVDQERLFRAEEFALEGWNSAHLSFIRLCHAFGKRLESCEPLL